ncbi:hypothetical protein H4219_002667 [Mycoemilia scoparia]|uniref:Uncharacterized protein n=1 Tax=Mycoemilia scoparia TaxID=417184 RepID=A0A9W8DNU4_9FUNG|nr:hypothetical protein H4219_002667 [Mycoemilia scoparia]
MAITNPTARKNDPDIRSPIGSIELGISLPLCGTETPNKTSIKTIKPGDTLEMAFSDRGAAHGGGHCQFAISYNNKDFAVIQDELRHCFKNGPSITNQPEKTKYSIRLPNNLPTGMATIGWTWINALGNREYYMGCVDVYVEGPTPSGNGAKFRGPRLLVVNHPTLGNGLVVPEFNGNYNTGLDLFDGRKMIEVGPGIANGFQEVDTKSGPPTSGDSSNNKVYV